MPRNRIRYGQTQKKEKRAANAQFIETKELYERLGGFEYSSKPISATSIAKKINRLIANDGKKKISYRQITKWLFDVGMLEYRDVGNGKMKRHPTPNGVELGVVLEFWDKRGGGKIPVIMYSEKAQKFIIDNVEAVMTTEVKSGKMSYPWGIDTADEA